MNLSNPSPSLYITVDATRSFTVRVEQSDIDKGVPGDPENCAIALAFKRALRKQLTDVSVRVFRTAVWVGYERGDSEHVIELFDLDGNGKNLVASMDTTSLAYPATVTILPRKPGRSKAANAAKNIRRNARIAAGIPANTKYHSRGGAKGTARTLAGIRTGSAAPRKVRVKTP